MLLSVATRHVGGGRGLLCASWGQCVLTASLGRNERGGGGSRGPPPTPGPAEATEDGRQAGVLRVQKRAQLPCRIRLGVPTASPGNSTGDLLVSQWKAQSQGSPANGEGAGSAQAPGGCRGASPWCRVTEHMLCALEFLSLHCVLFRIRSDLPQQWSRDACESPALVLREFMPGAAQGPGHGWSSHRTPKPRCHGNYVSAQQAQLGGCLATTAHLWAACLHTWAQSAVPSLGLTTDLGETVFSSEGARVPHQCNPCLPNRGQQK